MTPAHQTTVDNMLKALAARTNEVLQRLAYTQPGKAPQLTIEQLRESPFGQDLTTVAHYVEGYTVEGNIDEMIQRTLRLSFAAPIQFSSNTLLRLPAGWHKTAFGILIGDAYRKLIPSKDRMTTAQAARALNIKRQSLYDWVEEGKLIAYYIHEKQTFHRPTILKLVEQRQQKQNNQG